VGQDHALGVTGAAGGVLEHSGVVCHHGRQRARVTGPQLLNGGHRPQRRDLGPQQPPNQMDLRKGDQHGCERVAQDRRLAAQMLLQPRLPRRRVDRDRHPTGHQRPHERREVFPAGRQHDRHRLTRPQPAPAEPGGHRRRPSSQVTVGDLLRRGLVLGDVQQADVRATRMGADMPRQGVEQGAGTGRRSTGLGHRRSRRSPGHNRHRRPGDTADSPQHLQPFTGGHGVQHAVRQHNPEGLLYPRPQLDKNKAVQAEVGSEPAVQPGLQGGARTDFPDEVPDGRHEQPRVLGIRGPRHY
jgi:hypothetical protein